MTRNPAAGMGMTIVPSTVTPSGAGVGGGGDFLGQYHMNPSMVAAQGEPPGEFSHRRRHSPFLFPHVYIFSFVR
jgi:hypothetical protein